MVYGVVQYDFHAERADELDAKAGEAIIVVAQSNPEWFVAKPIGRLGGPGLIPVSFIDIKDTATMQSVPDPLEAVRKAGVPRVEEWKKFAAEYKNSSISLGKFDNPQAQMSAEMARMSLQNAPAQQPLPRQTEYVSGGSHLELERPKLMKSQADWSQDIPAAVEHATGARQCLGP
jgi:bud emergence protein 1